MSVTGKPVRFATVGLGFGESRCRMIAETAETELVAVCSRTTERASEVAAKFGCDAVSDHRALLDRPDVDAIALYTPNAAHLDIAVAAAEAGKHVVVCKPLEVNAERAERIVRACREAGTQLVVEFDTHYHHGCYRTYRAVASGRLGRIVQGEYVNKCHRGQAYYETNGGWRRLGVLDGGGAVINQGIHALDQMIWYHGRPVGAFALAGNFAHDIEAEDTASAVVEFHDGSFATFAVTTTFHNDRPRSRYGEGTMKRAEVSGRDGSVTMIDDEITMWELHGEPRGDAPELPELPPENVFQDFAWTLNRPGHTSPTLVANEASLHSLRLADAIYESTRTRTYVAVADATVDLAPARQETS